jgi:hypothetical protein
MVLNPYTKKPPQRDITTKVHLTVVQLVVPVDAIVHSVLLEVVVEAEAESETLLGQLLARQQLPLASISTNGGRRKRRGRGKGKEDVRIPTITGHGHNQRPRSEAHFQDVFLTSNLNDLSVNTSMKACQ